MTITLTPAQHAESNLKVMAAMFGIRYVTDNELEYTLSSLYLDGFKAGQESNAAPQMLEALQKAEQSLLAAFPHADRIRDILQPAIATVREAIAAATQQ